MKAKIFFVKDPTRKKGKIGSAFESDINSWLADNPGVEIENIEQSTTSSYGETVCMISIWYD